METLLTVAVVAISLSTIVMAGVLVATGGRGLMAPLETVTANLKTASDDLVDRRPPHFLLRP